MRESDWEVRCATWAFQSRPYDPFATGEPGEIVWDGLRTPAANRIHGVSDYPSSQKAASDLGVWDGT